MSKIRVAVITKGHPFEAEPFFAMFDADPTIEWTHVEQPDALALVDPEHAAQFDVFVMYDMPGITFTGSDPPVDYLEPPPGYIDAFGDLVAAGKGLVFLHHAIAGWPSWPEYGELIGGRFNYQPAPFAGVDYPDSGYRHDVTHTIEVLEPNHPICAGLEATFELTDEPYLFPVMESSVRPLMRSTHRFTDDGFYSADRAIRGERNSRDGWNHPEGSDLVVWTKSQGNSPIAYIQFGDGPATYANANYRKVLTNAIGWAAAGPDE